MTSNEVNKQEAKPVMKKVKACLNCRADKPLKAYRTDKYTRDKLTNWCDACLRIKEGDTANGGTMKSKPTAPRLAKDKGNGSGEGQGDLPDKK